MRAGRKKSRVEPKKATLADLISLHEKGQLVGVFITSIEDYHASPGISKSGLDDVAICPAVFKYNRANPIEPTDDMEFGNAAHTAILEPKEFQVRYVICPSEVNRKGTRAWDEIAQAYPGAILLKWDAGERLKGMAQAAHSHSRSSLLKGHTELSFYWKDPETGLQCKCRVDNLPGKGVAVDYKSARDAGNKRKWARSVHEYRYHVQAPFYLDGIWYAMTQSGVELELVPTPPDCFVFFAQEKDEPYLCKPWAIGDSSIALGRRIYQQNLKTIAECERTGVWPGYPENVEMVECPEYAWNQESDE
jgi:hypothetical protein